MDLQNHKRNEVVDHTQYHGEGGMDHMERPNAEQAQNAVQETIILQDTHPCVGTYQHIDPCGQGDEHDPEKSAFFRALCDHIGNGIAQKHADDGGRNGDHHGTLQHVQKNFVRQETGEVLQRKTEGSHFIACRCHCI